MRSKNTLYKVKNDLVLLKNQFPDLKPDKSLLQVFCGHPDDSFISAIISELRDVFPGSPVLGTTTAGEVMDGESLDNQVVINLMQFENTRVRSALVSQNDDLFAAGRQLSIHFNEKDSDLIILFGCGLKDGVHANSEPLLIALKEHCPGVQVCGAKAGDNFLGQRTFVFTEEGVTDQGVAGAVLMGNALNVNHVYDLSWIPIGKKMTVTRAEGRRLYTIDDRPAKEVYSHYLGENAGNLLPVNEGEFPLVVERKGRSIARRIINVHSDGSVDLVAPVEEGETIRFSFCHAGLLMESSKKIYSKLKPHNCQAIFIYACPDQKTILADDINAELIPIGSLATFSGFFCYGEYYSTKEENLLFFQTMSVLGLSEVDDTNEDVSHTHPSQYDFNQLESRQSRNLRGLHRLVETSAKEREELISELQSALSEIKTLKGFIPICSQCKNIRDDEGYWNLLESYLEKHSDASFSHSLCPTCADKLFGDEEWYKAEKNK